MTHRADANAKQYYFIDIDPYSRQIVSWGTAPKEEMAVKLTNGCYRVFLSKGQYNKLVEQLKSARG